MAFLPILATCVGRYLWTQSARLMVQSTLDAFVRNTEAICQATMEHELETATDAAEEQEAQEAQETSKDVPRLRVAGTSTVLRTIAEAREHMCDDGSIFPRHAQLGVTETTVAPTASSWPRSCAAPPSTGGRRPSPRRVSPRSCRSHWAPTSSSASWTWARRSPNSWWATSARTSWSWTAMPRAKATRASPRASRRAASSCAAQARRSPCHARRAPADATCKAVLACFKKCRSVETMRTAAIDYYDAHLANRFP